MNVLEDSCFLNIFETVLWLISYPVLIALHYLLSVWMGRGGVLRGVAIPRADPVVELIWTPDVSLSLSLALARSLRLSPVVEPLSKEKYGARMVYPSHDYQKCSKAWLVCF